MLFRKGFSLLSLLVIFFAIFLYRMFFTTPLDTNESISFTIEQGESVAALATRLEEAGLIRSATWFSRYIQLKGIDTKIQAGTIAIEPPITFAHIADALLKQTAKQEKEITLLPGWDNRDIATYLSEQGLGTSDDILDYIGKSAVDYRKNGFNKQDFSDHAFIAAAPDYATLEGYLAPDTYRIFHDATLSEVIKKLLDERSTQLPIDLIAAINESGRTVHEVMIIASLLEREVRSPKDKALVADIFWRRLDTGWALQADSTVHYLTNKSGDVFTTASDRNVDSPWNTYKYPGLPLGPIANPSPESIQAAVFPEKNDYWYFLTTLDTGEVHYGKTLDEHNANVARYLR